MDSWLVTIFVQSYTGNKGLCSAVVLLGDKTSKLDVNVFYQPEALLALVITLEHLSP